MSILRSRIVSRVKSTGLVNRLIRYSPRYYGEVRRLLRDLDAMDRDRRRELSLRLTERALTWARRAPAGREHGPSSSLADWPIVDRRELRENARFYAVPEYSWLPAATAGTAGTPLSVDRSRRCLAAGQAFIDDLMGVWDLTFATARIARLRADRVRVSPDGRPPYGVYGNRRRVLSLASDSLNIETAAWYHSELQAFRPDVLYAHPSVGERLTRFLNELGLKLEIPLILTSSQALAPQTRRLMEEAFDATVIDYYSQVERVSFAAGVAVGAYFFNPAYGHVELEAAPGFRAPPGHRAFDIIATGFWNEAMPLVRYRTDDVVIIPDSYSPADVDDVTLGLKPVAAIRRRWGEQAEVSSAC